LITCAPTGAENASAATTATPVKRCFVVIGSPPLSNSVVEQFGKDAEVNYTRELDRAQYLGDLDGAGVCAGLSFP
jgi:hypothetical protein